MRKIFVLICLATIGSCTPSPDKIPAVTDTSTPLHRLRPDYPVPYGPMEEEEITACLTRVLGYLEQASPAGLVNRNTGEEIPITADPDTAARLAGGDFRLVSYEWGVLYAGMLLATEATGNPAFAAYTRSRMKFISEVVPKYRSLVEQDLTREYAFRSILRPQALDDAGSMCAAMIKSLGSGLDADLRPMIDRYIEYISSGQYRLEDGTLARNRPLPNTLWLDDLFMSVPALAQMGELTGETKYFDDAVRQVRQFYGRMFVPEKGLFMHGWVEGMEVHPEVHWARANGWALMAVVELMDVLPEDHPGRDEVLAILRAHVRGLAALQSGGGFWHQLLDRPDSYLETSATAIYAYSMARAINRGWIDARAYGPPVILAWNAVSTKINERGQVEGTCVGTGMAFDPAFYYYRPVNVFAAHGYGPVMLAGSEVIKMTRNFRIGINDSAVMFYDK